MTIYDYLLWVVIWILGAVYGWYARERQARKTIDRFITQVVGEQPDTETSRIHVTIERHNGVFYVYDKDNNEFMAQGSTRKELEINLAKRYPNMHFAATSEDLKVFNEPL